MAHYALADKDKTLQRDIEYKEQVARFEIERAERARAASE